MLCCPVVVFCFFPVPTILFRLSSFSFLYFQPWKTRRWQRIVMVAYIIVSHFNIHFVFSFCFLYCCSAFVVEKNVQRHPFHCCCYFCRCSFPAGCHGRDTRVIINHFGVQ